VVGNSNRAFSGIVYLPDRQFGQTGNNSGTRATGQLIVNGLTKIGNTTVDVKYKKYVDINIHRVYLTGLGERFRPTLKALAL
jgi:hypothetical protein